MKDGIKFVITSEGAERLIHYEELNQLKKDILWIYDENIGELNSAFAPSYSFKLKYWEYLTLNGDKWFFEEEKQFYKIGSLIILLCFCVEYNDTASGDQNVFSATDIPIIINYVEKYVPNDDREVKLKDKILLGLKIANSIKNSHLLNQDFVSDGKDEFYNNLNEISDDFIVSYYERRLKR